LILSGKPGRGKTHLAVAIGYRAIQNGFDARFVTAAELIDDLSAAFRSGHLADALATYIHPGVLIVDEVGYLTYGTDAANMLFHVVNDRHRKKRAMIFTTNKAVTTWGRVLHDEDLAHAIVDRILERGRVLTLDGPSLRTKHLGLDDPTSSEALHQPARISGIEGAEFPEPTRGWVPRRRHVPAVRRRWADSHHPQVHEAVHAPRARSRRCAYAGHVQHPLRCDRRPAEHSDFGRNWHGEDHTPQRVGRTHPRSRPRRRD
jgi:IstB-like ATP binding protein